MKYLPYAFTEQGVSISRAFDLVHIKGRPRPPAPVPLAVDKADLILRRAQDHPQAPPPEPQRLLLRRHRQRARASPRRLGERFRFCFVCLHPDAPSHALLTYAQLEPLIKVKRAQYQINLR